MPESSVPDTQEKTILIVDDDRSIGEMLMQTIAQNTIHRAVWIAESDLVLETARHLHPSLILLDLTMPVMNGWQFRAEQRRDPDLSEIPVLVLSAGEDGTLEPFAEDLPEPIASEPGEIEA